MKKFFYGRSHVNKNRKLLNLSLAIFSVLIFGIVTAYAALNMTISTRFNLVRQRYIDNSSNSDNGYNWDGWNNYNASMNSGSFDYYYSYNGYDNSVGTYDVPGCGPLHIDGNEATIQEVSMYTPGSKCIYQMSVYNSSSTTARVGQISPIEPSNTSYCTISTNNSKMVCQYHTFVLSTDSSGNSLLSVGKKIPAYSSLTLYLTVYYNGSDPMESWPKDHYGYDSVYDGGFKLYFGA